MRALRKLGKEPCLEQRVGDVERSQVPHHLGERENHLGREGGDRRAQFACETKAKSTQRRWEGEGMKYRI